MNRQLTVSISILMITLLIILFALNMLLHQPIKKNLPVVSSLTPTPTPLASLTPTLIPLASLTSTTKPINTPTFISISPLPVQSTFTAIPAPIKKPVPVIPSLTPTTKPINASTPTPIPVSPSPVQSTPTSITTPLLISPTALDHVSMQPECQYDTHGGGIYLACNLTLQNISSNLNVSWGASINETDYTINPSAGNLAPGKTSVFQFIALTFVCPRSYMITVTSNVNTLHVPIICTDVTVTPNGNTAASDICSITDEFTYTCNVLLLADPANTVPTNWSAAAVSTGGAESIIFSPPNGTLALGSSIEITITIIDPQCPSDSIELAFFVPSKPAIPLSNNRLIWIC